MSKTNPSRLPHEPTPERRRVVHSLTGYGASQDVVARTIGCDPKTLRRWYRAELETGREDAALIVQQCAFKMASSGRSPMSTFKWLAARCPEWWIKDDAGAAPRPDALGKKERAWLAATTAGQGSDWGDDLVYPGDPVGRPN